LTLGTTSFALAQVTPFPAVAADQLGAEGRAELAAEAPYLAENDRAMSKMMNDMAVKPNGNDCWRRHLLCGFRGEGLYDGDVRQEI
jgi:hypothetical protein